MEIKVTIFFIITFIAVLALSYGIGYCIENIKELWEEILKIKQGKK